MMTIFFEGHALTSDNEAGVASGHNDVELSEAGRIQAAGEKRQRYESIVIDTVFTSDLRRAYETATIMFKGKAVPIIQDARLRECNYGDLTQRPRPEMEAVRARSISDPFPNGESLGQVMDRMQSFINDLSQNHDGQDVLIIGHMGTLWGLEHHINDTSLPALLSGKTAPTRKYTLCRQ
ncbi:MAG: histidine phosphatase family protein [SAR202 cluster bacterium]|jgi:broad specificity phosphatase PhoE|nr:histidine phosphatase family protein [SAR202 cluster bacterium]MDP6512157.1 histidine phosphatase family protein [SAR202 cluster bacterium]MDP6713593.1 histidine phosphatase family protein [SAR202 cluster bacterium]